MKFLLYIPLLICLMTIHSIYAQVQYDLDSLQTKYESLTDSEEKINTVSILFNTVLYSDAESALNYAREELELSERLHYTKGIADGLYHIGVYHTNTHHQDSARIYYTRASDFYKKDVNIKGLTAVIHGLAIVEYTQGNYTEAFELLEENIRIYTENLNDTSDLDPVLGLAVTYDLMGQIQMFKGNHKLALERILKSLRYFDDLDEPLRRADALNNIASVEFYLNNYEKSISYNSEAYKIYTEYNDKLFSANALNDIGNAYFYMNNYDSAILYLEKSMTLSEEMRASDLIGTALNNLGKVYTKQGKYQKSISLLSQALEIHEETMAKSKIVESLNDLGIAHNQLDLPENAIIYFNRAIEMANDIDLKESQRIGYYNRALSYEKLNNYYLALDDYKAFKTAEDSIFNLSKSQQIEELRTIYEMEKKEKELVLQKSEIEVLIQKDKINNLQNALLGGGLGLSLLVFGLIIYGVNQRMKRNHLERERLNDDLEFKKKELTSHALHLANKNEVLEELKQKVKSIRQGNHEPRQYNQLIQTINFNLQNDNNWENFRKYFEEVHKDFNSKIKQTYPDLTSNELRLVGLLKMNLSSKEIANLLNISQEGIKKARYRLRKKMNISSDESLDGLILGI